MCASVANQNKNIKNGDEGTIIAKRQGKCKGIYLVEVDKDIKGHDGCNRGQDGHCCWITGKKIRRIVKTK